MAKADKMLSSKRERRERRFFPRPTASPAVVYALGGVGALVLGAGAWAQWFRVVVTNVDASATYGTWVLAAGIVIIGVAIWFGTSGEPTLRVGDGGVVVEKGGVRRMAWHAVDSVTYEGASATVVARGHDEGGGELVVRARVASHPQAAAWIVAEARSRVPSVVSIGDDVALPAARPTAGERVTLDPVQIVGRRCAASNAIIAFEPDGRLCSRCERVYHRDHLPETCLCGGSLAKGKTKGTEEGERESDSSPEAKTEATAQESHA
jgi:hypothetical protein